MPGKRTVLVATLALVMMAGAACRDDGDGGTEAAAGDPSAIGVDPADFTSAITNPLFPMSSFRTAEFAGRQRNSDGSTVATRVVSRRLDKTDTIAGVTVAVIEVAEYKGEELVELTEDYFAQHRDGTVWYFGERVTDYKDGKPAGHGGQWLAGEKKSRPGVFMPANPTVGQEFAPETVPDVADERSRVLELGVEVTVPAGTFTGCVKVEDHDLVDDGRDVKFYCPGKGLVREESPSGSTDLVHLA